MSLLTTTRGTTEENKTPSALSLKVPDGARILIVSDDADVGRLKTVLQEAGFVSEIARTMTAGCDAARSGRFQVVVSKPLLSDGSWRHLIDIANHYDLGFEVIVWARNFDLRDSAQAMREGAFDVFVALPELPRAIEVVKRALWTAYLKGAGPFCTAVSPVANERSVSRPPAGHLHPSPDDVMTREHVV